MLRRVVRCGGNRSGHVLSAICVPTGLAGWRCTAKCRIVGPTCCGPPREHRFDLVIILIDGLSGAALSHDVVPLITSLLAGFTQLGWQVAPIVLGHLGRVAIGDQIGAALGSTLAMVVIGERPGLSASDSMGIYLTYGPRPGRTDAQRNCISNVRPDGLAIDIAARLAIQQAQTARQQGYTGVVPP